MEEEQLGMMGEAPVNRWKRRTRAGIQESRDSPERRRMAGRTTGDPGSWEQRRWSQTDTVTGEEEFLLFSHLEHPLLRFPQHQNLQGDI